MAEDIDVGLDGIDRGDVDCKAPSVRVTSVTVRWRSLLGAGCGCPDAARGAMPTTEIDSAKTPSSTTEPGTERSRHEGVYRAGSGDAGTGPFCRCSEPSASRLAGDWGQGENAGVTPPPQPHDRCAGREDGELFRPMLMLL